MRSLKPFCLGFVLPLVLAATAALPARALSVFDSANFTQNLLTAVRSLQQVNNQIQSLQNEAQVLINMSRHLQRMDYNSLGQINRALSQIHLLMQRAEGMTFDIVETERAFAERFPKQYDAMTTNDRLAQDARARWRHAMDAYQHTMRVQAHISQELVSDQSLVRDLVANSQGAVGSLQAQQAGNQLLALSIQQSAKTQQLMAAQFRAQALTDARRAAAEEQMRARFSRFIGDGKAYTPLD